jgi:aspartyl-tRNA synthetase
LPIDNSDKSNTFIDKRIDYRFLDTRNKKVNTIFKLRSKIVRYVTDYFDENGFTIINTPKLTNIGVESGAELFNVDYFGRPAYLAQSPQVYKQMFVGGGFERVAEIAPVFRAEKSHTNRHLTEFMGVDLEMGFIDDEHDVMDFIAGMFSNLIKQLNKNCKDEMELLGVSYKEFEKIPRIPMPEAKKILEKLGKKLGAEEDLDQEAEKMLGKYAQDELGSDFVFITNYPWSVRPFYHMKPKDDSQGTRSFDLLFKGVEICTGAQREHRYDILVAQAKEKGLDFTTMGKYAELFTYGMPPHGGAGFGLDRITQRLLELENVREAVLLPRDPERLEP